jgi:ABC-type enterochelin transport system permease subunit
MNTRRLIWIVYIAVSVLVGVGAGHWFFGLFVQVVPPAVMTSFNRTTAHGYFLMNGAVLGVVMALWGVLAFWVARITGGKTSAPAQTSK